MKTVAILATFLVASVSADFHITRLRANDGHSEDFRDLACPSNYWNCNCFLWNDRGKGVTNGDGNFFTVSEGLCGMKQMNFYKNPDEGDNVWDYYEDGGDGTKIGSCYGNEDSDSKRCYLPGVTIKASDLLVCYGYPCEP